MSTPAAGQVKVGPVDNQRYVWIPPGTFEMGCSASDSECYDNEKPRHRVTLTKGYWMGETEVTVGAYRKYAQSAKRAMPRFPVFVQGEEHPVIGVGWNGAKDYCGWSGGRLPTEAEWEYAARAGSSGPRYGQIDDIAWSSQNAGKSPHPVGQKARNGFGLHDMLGNVWEWCADWFDIYRAGPQTDPTGPEDEVLRVLRGGSWLSGARQIRFSARYADKPEDEVGFYGFRCVQEIIR